VGYPIIDPEVLAEELRQTNQRGYAVDREEFLAGICCVGVPVRGASGGVEAALGVSGSVFQLREEDVEQMAQLLQDATYELSGRLGYLV
jgi:IclR family acetate operon transcriptional repressor